ncbi:cyclophilin-like fold protein [Duffyella gerundensis]|uniref:cyclophilin-like fold protein n=1 Tax=Duffyella gerundensis TaxID=1619313 RepID=UPI0021F7D459|nr:cyclophilin-like fold protein [Duffyella gerundensis]
MNIRPLIALLLATLIGYLPVSQAEAETAKEHTVNITVQIDRQHFTLTLNDSPAARAFVNRLPLTLDMAELNGNEKHADLAEALPENPVRPGHLRAGDLMLYGDKTLVLFYSRFDSGYRYTPLGRVDNPVGLAHAVGNQSVRIHFAVK